MKELRELMEWVKLKVRRVKFIVKEDVIVNSINEMAIKLGKQDRISTFPHENNLEIRFYSLPDFFKQVVSIKGIGIKADISLGDFSYSKQYFYHALKLVKDPDIGIPNMEYPLIIRNNTCSVFIAPKIYEEEMKDNSIGITNSIKMNKKEDINPFYPLNRMERFALLLLDVRKCFSGEAHRLSREKISQMLDDIVHNEHLFYMIFFMGAYQAVKKENESEEQKKESINAMEVLMGWEKQSVREKVNSIYNRPLNVLNDELASKKDRDTPTKEFSILMKLFREKKDSLTNFTQSQSFYKEILNPPPQATLYVAILLENVANFFRFREKKFNWDQMENIMEDIFEILLEWISIVAGLTYYHLKYHFGTKEQVEDLLDALKDINGYGKHRKLDDLEELPHFSLSGRGAESSKFEQINLELDDGCPSVISYEDEGCRCQLQDSEDLVIKDEMVKILFQYPLTNEILVEFENSGGFTRMDIFRCIYEGYKSIYEEEEKEVGDPGNAPNLMNRARSYGKYGIWGHYMEELYIEGVLYNKSSKTIKLRMGS